MLGRTRRIHFVGIGGIGMSGIAELLANLGYAVSGSDVRRSDITARLQQAFNVEISEGHAAASVGNADVVVFSSAVRPDNAEIAEARRRGIPVIPRGEMLAELMRLKFSIAVAGSHGKTTTSSMIALVLERAGLDPTAVIGGRVSAFGSNTRLGRGEYMVAEADESDRSFLAIWPSLAVITNIDREHLDAYGSFANLQQAFTEFANKTPFYGTVVACVDDPAVAAIVPHVRRSLTTYSLDDPTAGFSATDISVSPSGTRCLVRRRRDAQTFDLGRIDLSIPGRHNLQNALAAIAVADALGIDFNVAAIALNEFRGAERRFQVYGEAGGVLVVDDYGHHPTEIAAVLAAARATLGRRLVVAFQPHRYSRTQQLMDAFGPSLKQADDIFLTDIYAAGEEAIPNVTIQALAAAVRSGSGRPVRVVNALDGLVDELLAVTRPGDVVITLGAGSIGSVPKRLFEALRQRGGSS